MVHDQEGLETAVEATEILFGKGTTATLKKLDEVTFLNIFEGVPLFTIERKLLDTGVGIIDLLGETTTIFPSKGEVRRTILGGGLSLNKTKIENENFRVKTDDLINSKYLLIQKGKKNYFLITTK